MELGIKRYEIKTIVTDERVSTEFNRKVQSVGKIVALAIFLYVNLSVIKNIGSDFSYWEMILRGPF